MNDDDVIGSEISFKADSLDDFGGYIKGLDGGGFLTCVVQKSFG